MKESEKRARLEIVLGGFGFALAGNAPFTRREFFAPPRAATGKPEDVAIAKAIVQKGWQGIFLDRLIEQGILARSEHESGRQSFYEIADKIAVSRLIFDYEKSDGNLISKHLFPGEAIAAAEEFITGSKNLGEARFVGAVSGEDESEDERVRRSLATMAAAIVDLREANITMSGLSIEFLKKIEDALIGFGEDVKTAFANANKDANGIKKRLDALEVSQGGLKRSIDGANARMATSQENISGAVKAVEGLVGMASIVEELIRSNREHRGSVDDLVKAMKRAEADRLGVALKTLAISQSELAVVRDILLEVSSEEASDGRSETGS